jgi:hypothetical protein
MNESIRFSPYQPNIFTGNGIPKIASKTKNKRTETTMERIKLLYHFISGIVRINNRMTPAVIKPVNGAMAIKTTRDPRIDKILFNGLPLGRISLREMASFLTDSTKYKMVKMAKIPHNHMGKRPGPGPNGP